jgi:hypothetical protein
VWSAPRDAALSRPARWRDDVAFDKDLILPYAIDVEWDALKRSCSTPHAAVWLASDKPVLGQKSCSLAVAARAENQLAISAISFWKIALLAAKDRLELHRRPAELRAELLDTGVMELALGCCAGGES